MNDRRGIALLMVLAAAVIAGSLAAVALTFAITRSRQASDARWRAEGVLVAGSALAATRVAHRADLDTIADGGVMRFPVVQRADGWSWQVTVTRSGALLRAVALVRYLASDGSIVAARRESLMLSRNLADTVRVLGTRARF